MSFKGKILIVDDDRELTDLLSDFLAKYQIKSLAAHTASEGMALYKRHQPELIILDVMLPDKLGFELCKEIRQQSVTPIIMLSARGDVYDRILGLELGADDYLPKPFEPRELLARIDSILRRQSNFSIDTSQHFKNSSLCINYPTETVELNHKKVELTHTEFRCLSYLIKHRHRILTRDLILAELRGLDWELDNRSVDILISRLRKKLEDDPANPLFIATIRGSGYRFILD